MNVMPYIEQLRESGSVTLPAAEASVVVHTAKAMGLTVDCRRIGEDNYRIVAVACVGCGG